MTELAEYHYPEQYRTLLAETRHHEMRVLHEDGLYRHLWFGAPGTGIWHFEIITWPGSLAIRGDIGGGHVFSRVDDMLWFFDSRTRGDGEINPHYWSEKLERGRRSVREFSAATFRKWLVDNEYEADDIVDGFAWAEEAIEYCDGRGIEWDDPGAWQDYEFHFILALHAILWGAKKYHAAETARAKDAA